jgi:hypothetical protein
MDYELAKDIVIALLVVTAFYGHGTRQISRGALAAQLDTGKRFLRQG